MNERNLLINPDELAPAIGYSHAVLAAPGRTAYLAGQIAFNREGQIVGDTWVEQFDLAMSNMVTALAGAGDRRHDDRDGR